VGVTEADGARLEAGAGPPAGPSHIVTLAKHTIVYGLSGVLLQAVGVVTLPIFARAFTQAEYGKLELGLVLSSVALTVVDLGFASAAQRSFYDYSDSDAEQRRSVLFTAIVATSTAALTAAVILAVLRGELDNWVFDGSNAERLILAIAISIPVVNAATFYRETMRLRFRQWSYVAAAVMAAILSAVVAVTLVVSFDAGVDAVFVGAIAGNALGVLYGAYVTRHDIGRHFSRPELKVMLAYGIPLVPAALSMWALMLVDRIILSRLSSLAEVGQYAVANRVSSVLLLVVTAFSLAFGPYVFSLFAEDQALERKVRADALKYFLVVLLTCAVGLTLYAREVLELVAPSFDRAYEAVGPLCFGIVAFGTSAVTVAGISFTRRMGYVPLVSGAAAIVNIALNFALIPPFGMIGAAIATAVGFLILAWLQLRLAQRLYPTPYETRKLLVAVVLAVACGAVGLVKIEPTLLALAVKTVTLLVFLASLRVASVIDEGDIGHARRLIAARRGKTA
jgi:O-antigen/teichoic acid export membrane protein